MWFLMGMFCGGVRVSWPVRLGTGGVDIVYVGLQNWPGLL